MMRDIDFHLLLYVRLIFIKESYRKLSMKAPSIGNILDKDLSAIYFNTLCFGFSIILSVSDRRYREVHRR
jgi:hypothetical protein